MSDDEFDPAIERLFNRAPSLSDSQAFEAKVMGRLHSSSRARTLVLSGAGLIGGFVAFKELMGMSIHAGQGRFEATAGSGSETATSALSQGGAALQGLMGGLGLENLSLGSVTDTQAFLGVACVVITVLTLGAFKLYQQV